jgi:hypothetical protein
LGGDVGFKHNVVVTPDERKATLFRDQEKITVNCLTWTEVLNFKFERPHNRIRSSSTKKSEESERQCEEGTEDTQKSQRKNHIKSRKISKRRG